MPEVGELAGDLPVEPVDVLPESRDHELRHLAIGSRGGRGRRGVLEGLVGHRAGGRRPGVVAVGEDRVARQARLGCRGHARRKVPEIVVVGDALRIHPDGPAAPELVDVLHREQVAVALGDRVIGQELDAGMARVRRGRYR